MRIADTIPGNPVEIGNTKTVVGSDFSERIQLMEMYLKQENLDQSMLQKVLEKTIEFKKIGSYSDLQRTQDSYDNIIIFLKDRID